MGDASFAMCPELRWSSIIVLIAGSFSQLMTVIMIGLYLTERAIYSLENSIYVIAVVMISVSTCAKMVAAALLLNQSMTDNLCLVLGGCSIICYSSGTVLSSMFYILLIAKIRRYTPFSWLPNKFRIRTSLILCISIAIVYSTLTTVVGSIRWSNTYSSAYVQVYGFCGTAATNMPLEVPSIFLPTLAVTITSFVAYAMLLAERGASLWRFGFIHLRCIGLNLVMFVAFFAGLFSKDVSYSMAAAVCSYSAVLSLIFIASEKMGPFRCENTHSRIERRGFTPSLQTLLAMELEGTANLEALPLAT